MKEIKIQEVINLEDYGVTVNPYLTYAQIQQIVDGVKTMHNWAERQINIDIGVLYHGTDIGKEKIEELGHDVLLQSGLVDEVKAHIKNVGQIYEAIEYTESTQRALARILKQLPELSKKLEKVGKTGASKK